MKSVVWQLDGHLRNAIEYSLSNRLNDALRHKLFSIVVGELKIWKLFEFNFTENMLSTSSLWRYMRLLLFMCSVELGVHLREVLRAPMDSLENENNREIHLVNIFQVIELSIDLLQRRMIETEEQPSESLRAEEREEVKVIEALVENIQVIVDFLEAEPLKREQKDDRQYIRLFKYSIVGFRIVCCFSSLQLPVLEKRISLVLVYSWNTILDDFEVILTSIEWDILYDLISWTGFGVTRLIEYSDIAMKTFECEIFSRVWIQLLQEFVKNRSIISTMTGSIPVTQVIYNIIEILVCLYEFPSNRRYINDHKDTLMSIRTLWPSEELKKLFTSDEVSHVVASQ
ncbi:hypothetical protein Gasu2_06530 [Galdieria sulphuraria]|nr:hypothetical protein Gasu2_06530 [Galdieria sulphuraria]